MPYDFCGLGPFNPLINNNLPYIINLPFCPSTSPSSHPHSRLRLSHPKNSLFYSFVWVKLVFVVNSSSHFGECRLIEIEPKLWKIPKINVNSEMKAQKTQNELVTKLQKCLLNSFKKWISADLTAKNWTFFLRIRPLYKWGFFHSFPIILNLFTTMNIFSFECHIEKENIEW
jgi:hypothetical protein